MKNRMTHFTKLGAVLSVLTLTACGGGTETKTNLNAVDPAAPVDDWRLVWSDEFDGTAINTNNWTHEVNCNGGGNQEKQCYTDAAENSFVSDGLLTIVAKPAADGAAQPYTSARMTTQNKMDFQYGRVEMRAKLPKGQGAWPAFWMMPTDSVYGGWPKSGEIDIMEAVNLGTQRADGTEETNIYGTLHYGAGPASDFTGASHTVPTNPGDDFHTYAIEWQEGEIRWYMDGYLYATQRQSQLRLSGNGDILGLTHRGWYAELYDVATGQLGTDWSSAPFDQDFFMILNVAVGGNWPESVNEGGIDASAFTDGQTLEVDYVRVYKCSADSLTGRGCETTAQGYDTSVADGGKLVDGRAPSPSLNPGAATPLTIFDDTVDINWVAWDCCGGSTPSLVADDADRGDVYEFTVENGNDGTVFGFISRTLFLSADPTSPSRATPHNALGMIADGYVTFDLKVTTPPSDPDSAWEFKIEADEAAGGEWAVPITTYGDAPVTGEWSTYQIPLQDIADGGVDLTLLDVIMVFPTWMTGDGAVFRLDNVAIEQPESSGGGAPAINDPLFASGEITSGWSLWDCCGGTTPAVVADDAERGNVVEFSIADNNGTVLGFNSRNEIGSNTADSPYDATALLADGVLSFDFKAVSNPANPDSTWLIKVEGANLAAPALEVPLANGNGGTAPVAGEWATYEFPIADILDAGVDITAIDVIMIFPAWQTGAGAVYRVDNLEFKRDGSAGPAPIALDPLFENGAVTAGWSLWDCCGGTTPTLVGDTAERGNVVEFSIADNNGTVLGFNSRNEIGSNTADSPYDATSIIANGVLTLDFKAVAQPANPDSTWLIKVEGANLAAPALEVPLANGNGGIAPVTGEWATYQFPIADILDAGVDVSAIDVVMIFPAWQTGAGAVYRVDNLGFAAAAGGSANTPTEPNEPTEPTEPSEPTNPMGPADTATTAPLFTDSIRDGWVVWDCCGGSTPESVAITDRGQVVQYTVTASGETVQGFSTRSAIGGGDALLDVSASEMTGSISFDLRVVSAPSTATAWLFKIESNGGVDNDAGGEAVEVNLNTSNEGVEPAIGEWQTYTFDLIDLTNAGLDISAIDVLLVYPTWGTGPGAVYQLDNIQVNKDGTSTPVVPVSNVAVMLPFADSGALLDGNTYSVPTSAQPWAGFANDNATVYPFNFAEGGTITFTAAIPEGGADATLRFRFEKAPFPDVDPAFDAGSVVINSATEATYTINIDAQDAANEYRSFLMYVDTRDAAVIVKDVIVTEGDSTPTQPVSSEIAVMLPFADSGALLDGNTYTVPTSAQPWAGFANDNAAVYPFNFAEGGTITFTAAIPEGGADATLRFRFEKAPFPDVDPAFDAGSIVINSATEATYTINIDAQDAANEYRSFLMYVDTRDAAVIVKDVVVTVNDSNTAPVTPPAAATGPVMLPFADSGALLDGNTFTVPTAAQPWAGFANDNAAIYPFNFGNGGTITFTAAIPEGGADVTLRFRFEKAPFPDVDPAFDAGTVLVNSTTETTYTITIENQDAVNEYRSFLMYVDTRDAAVIVKDIVVTATAQ